MLWNADGVVSRCERLHVVSNKDTCSLDILAKLEEAVGMWGLAFGGASPQADMTGLATQGVPTWTPGTSNNDNDSSSATCSQRWIREQMLHGNACGGAGVWVPLCAAAVRQGRYCYGEPAINRLGSAPRSGMGSGEQSAAVESREKRMQDGHRHQAKTPSTRAHADLQRLTVLSFSGFNTIAKRAKNVSTLCSQPSSFIRVHKPYLGRHLV